MQDRALQVLHFTGIGDVELQDHVVVEGLDQARRCQPRRSAVADGDRPFRVADRPARTQEHPFPATVINPPPGELNQRFGAPLRGNPFLIDMHGQVGTGGVVGAGWPTPTVRTESWPSPLSGRRRQTPRPRRG